MSPIKERDTHIHTHSLYECLSAKEREKVLTCDLSDEQVSHK